MKNNKNIILILGILLALLSNFARLGTFGFFYLFGLLSILIFGSIHIVFLVQLSKYFEKLNFQDKINVWIGILTYPLIFLFQFDIEEYVGATYTYEFFTGRFSSNFQYYAYYIAIGGLIIYLTNYIIWHFKIKKYK